MSINVNILKKKNQEEIAKTVKCSRCAVQTTIKHFEDTNSHSNRKRIGQKKSNYET